MAATPGWNIPDELRALVDFIEVDSRPIAILNAAYDATQKEKGVSNVVHQNPALKRLGVENSELEHILKDLGNTNGVTSVNGEAAAANKSGSWTSTTVAQKWKVLIYDDSLPVSNESDSHSNSDSTSHHTSDFQRSPQCVNLEPDYKVPAYCRDWTRFPDQDWSGLPPWTEYVRTFDWGSNTDMGPMESWSERLRGYVMHIMRNPSPRLLIWGPNRTLVYNEACIPLYGEKHPDCFAKSAKDWAELWNEIGVIIEDCFAGKITEMRMPLVLHRNGFLEETCWDFVAIPVTGVDGRVAAMFAELTDTTKVVLGERRRSSVMKIREQISSASSLSELWFSYLAGLESAVEDVPFVLLYSVADDASDSASDTSNPDSDPTPIKRCTLEGSLGISSEFQALHNSFTVMEHNESDKSLVDACFRAWRHHKAEMVKEDGPLRKLLNAARNGRGFEEDVQTVMVSPITSLISSDVQAILVTGLNPRSPVGEEYSIYTYFLADLLIKAASLISLPHEQRRAQKIADDMNSALAQQLRLITLQAEKREARFSRMAAEAPTGMFVFDPEGRPLYVNDAYLSTLGQTEEEHNNRSHADLAWKSQVHPEDLQKFTHAWERVLEAKAPLTIEHRLKKPWTSIDKASGQEVSGETWLLCNAFADVDGNGEVSSVQGWLTDISHRKFTENLLARQLEDALETKRQSENFIDMTSHEMRNPLSAILQSADSIVTTFQSVGIPSKDETISLTHNFVEEIVDAAQTIILCAQHQKRIVDDILTLSKLDASLLEISPDKVQPPVLLDKALKMYEAEMARANISAVVHIEPTYQELGVDWVILDPSRLLQVVINLLTNAIKFTRYSDKKEISIYLGASYEKPTGQHHGVNFIPTKHAKAASSPLAEWGDGEMIYVQIAVSDTGKGLSDDEIQVLFKRFSQTYKKYGGSGLGLFISRELCELQSGQIGVSSGGGKTTFTFFVRGKKWAPTVPSNDSQKLGVPRWTSTSASPVAFTRKGSVVMENSGMAEEPPSIDANFGELLELPEELSTLNRNGEQPLTRQPSMTNASPTLSVLIVEDNLINQKVMSKQLRRAGCIVHVANHGLECLSFLEKTTFCCGETDLSLILLDLE